MHKTTLVFRGNNKSYYGVGYSSNMTKWKLVQALIKSFPALRRLRKEDEEKFLDQLDKLLESFEVRTRTVD